MKHIRDRQKFRKKLYSRTVRIALLVVLIFLINPAWGMYEKYIESRKNLESARAEMAALQAKERTLKEQIDDLQTERGRDKEIRDKFGVVKDNEFMVVFVRDKESRVGEVVEEVGQTLPRFFGTVKSFFGIEN